MEGILTGLIIAFVSAVGAGLLQYSKAIKQPEGVVNKRGELVLEMAQRVAALETKVGVV